MTSSVHVERNYRTDEGAIRAALVVDGAVVAILGVNACFDLSDALLAAGERLITADGGDEYPSCPRCGTAILAASVDGDKATLTPCGHEIAPDHPVLGGQGRENGEENDQ